VDRARKNQRIGRLLHEVTALVDQAAERTLREHSALTLSQFLLLLGVSEQDDAPTQQEIATHLGIDRAAVSRQVARLEARGLLTRRREDGRSNALELTPAGEAELRRAQRAMEEHMTPHYTAPRDPDALLEALEAVRRSLLSASKGDQGR
jgi:DNA-binding MarR family transcriptional regulator